MKRLLFFLPAKAAIIKAHSQFISKLDVKESISGLYDAKEESVMLLGNYKASNEYLNG